MRRRVSRDDMRSAVVLARREQQEWKEWAVCEDYELHEDTIVSKYPILSEDNALTRWREYKPLEDAPDIFLQLAGLHEESAFVASALHFSRKYGLLGGSSSSERVSRNEIKLDVFRQEAARAWKILRLYEAVLNQDVAIVRALAPRCERALTVPEVSREYMEQVYEEFEAHLYKEVGEAELEQFLLGEGLNLCVRMVNETVRKHCSYGASVPFGGYRNGFFSADSSTVRSVWHFGSLLGAAYLQMYWLITSGGELARCVNCGRLLSLARPNPEGRKRRSDKKFCDDACRQAHHRSKKP